VDFPGVLEKFSRDFRESIHPLLRRKLRPVGFLAGDGEDAVGILFHPATGEYQLGGRELQRARPELSWHQTSPPLLQAAFKTPWGLADLMINGSLRTTVPAEYRGQDFVFWALNLIRHTGYLDLRSLWFLRWRGVKTALRRHDELLDILLSALFKGGLMEGNLTPRKVSASAEAQHG
jgi:hypothetical protein